MRSLARGSIPQRWVCSCTMVSKRCILSTLDSTILEKLYYLSYGLHYWLNYVSWSVSPLDLDSTQTSSDVSWWLANPWPKGTAQERVFYCNEGDQKLNDRTEKITLKDNRKKKQISTKAPIFLSSQLLYI